MLNKFTVDNLWGIGKKKAQKLNEAGIFTALQFRECSSKWIRANMSINEIKIQKELFGEVCFPIKVKIKRKRNICTSRSFRKEISKLPQLKEVIASYASNCAAKLRKEKNYCKTISVFLNTNRFRSKIKQYHPYRVVKLHTPTNDSAEIVKVATKILCEIYIDSYHYKKAGVIIGDNISENSIQLSLFDSTDRKKRAKINSVVDKINSKLLGVKVKLASQGNINKLTVNNLNLSPCYTTRFEDLLKVFI